MTIKPKYKISQILKHKYQNETRKNKTSYLVTEIQTITCSAGTQIFYYCRIIGEESYTDYAKKGRETNITKGVTEKIVKFNEIEIELSKESL